LGWESCVLKIEKLEKREKDIEKKENI